MGGINHLLSAECLECMPLVSKIPTMIFGMAVSSDVPSIAAVVGSRKWPLIAQYRASVRALSSRVDMIDGLFEPVSPKRDEGMIRELLEDFYESTCKMKPEHIIIFRDGVNGSQFDRVLNVELDQIMKVPNEHECQICRCWFICAVAPICYAHQAAAQMSQIGGGGSDDNFIQIPKLHEDVCNSMFFC
ncbi:protein argonaute 4A-like [Bidens hawaiensis]|uniref:protein argonaute 4A-like n=1 Tax=Bidens hawaiensis TaxID=980011 RepID=UPI00404B7573